MVLAVMLAIAGYLYPKAMGYRTQAYNSRALSAIHDIGAAENLQYTVNGGYVRCTSATQCNQRLSGLRVGRELAVSVTTQRNNTAFTARVSHPKGTKTYRWDSSRGGLQ